jgi:hypothetical protein
LEVDSALIERTIAVWPMLLPTVRGIQRGLELILGVHRSIGYISQVLNAAGEQAAILNTQAVPLDPVLAEADETFQGRQPCLTVVDGHSFLVLNLAAAESRDATSWGLTFLDLQARGVRLQDLATDGGKGLLAGAQEARLAVPLRPDLFHLIAEAHRVSRRLEKCAYHALETAERARRAQQEAAAAQRRRGRPLQVKVPLAQAAAAAEQAITSYDAWAWLWSEIRCALEPITAAGGLMTVSEVCTTVETALELLLSLNLPDITAFVHKLQSHLQELIAPLAWLEEQLAPWRHTLDAASEAFVVWAAQHLHLLDSEQDLPSALQPIVHAFAQALTLFHRSSSLAESLHSWLRPHWQVHRGMPKWLAPLLQLFWNHHPFQRGKRAGNTPLQLAGIEDGPSLRQVLDLLFCDHPIAQPV